jgi:hypothetical protein
METGNLAPGSSQTPHDQGKPAVDAGQERDRPEIARPDDGPLVAEPGDTLVVLAPYQSVTAELVRHHLRKAMPGVEVEVVASHHDGVRGTLLYRPPRVQVVDRAVSPDVLDDVLDDPRVMFSGAKYPAGSGGEPVRKGAAVVVEPGDALIMFGERGLGTRKTRAAAEREATELAASMPGVAVHSVGGYGRCVVVYRHG